MTEEQKNFLKELHKLFEKYGYFGMSIDEDKIILASFDGDLSFNEYYSGMFREVNGGSLFILKEENNNE